MIKGEWRGAAGGTIHELFVTIGPYGDALVCRSEVLPSSAAAGASGPPARPTLGRARSGRTLGADGKVYGGKGGAAAGAPTEVEDSHARGRALLSTIDAEPGSDLAHLVALISRLDHLSHALLWSEVGAAAGAARSGAAPPDLLGGKDTLPVCAPLRLSRPTRRGLADDGGHFSTGRSGGALAPPPLIPRGPLQGGGVAS